MNGFVQINKKELSKNNLKDKSLIVPGILLLFRMSPLKVLPTYTFVRGEVFNPGRFLIRNRSEDVMTILEQTGGLTPRANPWSLQILRPGIEKPIPIPKKILEENGEIKPYFMNSMDTLVVLRDDRSVEVIGSVLNPGVIPFSEDFDWEDYINKGAGGALDTADFEKTFIMYPNGITYRAEAGWFHFDPDVVSGAKIVVPQKAYVEPSADSGFDYREFMAGLNVTMAVLTSMLTVVILSKQ